MADNMIQMLEGLSDADCGCDKTRRRYSRQSQLANFNGTEAVFTPKRLAITGALCLATYFVVAKLRRNR